MTSPYPDTTNEAMVETAAPHRKLDAHRWEWLEPMLHDWGIEEGRPCRLKMQIDKFYPSTKAAQQDKDSTLDALELERGWISNLESRLEESKAREVALERHIRVMVERFRPPGSRQ
ncbi:hypothetical protein Tco_0731086 [Tanacetum coccineum]